jgi:integration host factor subunit beta
MTKRALVNRIAVATGLPKVRVREAVELLFDHLMEILATEGRIELRNFGVFRTVEQPAHDGVNPRTGEPMTIEANRHVRFRAGKRLREILNPEP